MTTKKIVNLLQWKEKKLDKQLTEVVKSLDKITTMIMKRFDPRDGIKFLNSLIKDINNPVFFINMMVIVDFIKEKDHDYYIDMALEPEFESVIDFVARGLTKVADGDLFEKFQGNKNKSTNGGQNP